MENSEVLRDLRQELSKDKRNLTRDLGNPKAQRDLAALNREDGSLHFLLALVNFKVSAA